jgi:hypothetical protein
MTEPVAAPAAPATPVADGIPPAAGTTPQAFDVGTCFNPDGTFKEGWKNSLVPEDLRTEKFFDIFTDIKGLVKTAGNQAKTIGKYSSTKGVLPINDKSTPEEIAAFEQAMGVPKTHDEYKLEIPKGMEGVFDQNLMAQAKQIFKDSRLNQAQVDALWKFETGRSQAAQLAQLKHLEEIDNAAEAQIHEAHSKDYDQALHLVNLGIEKITAAWPEEKRVALFGTEDQPGGINAPELAHLRPHLFDFLSSLGSMFAEAKMINPEDGGGGESYGIQSQIESLRAEPGFANGTLARTNPKRHREIIEQINNLTTRIQPGNVNTSAIGR